MKQILLMLAAVALVGCSSENGQELGGLEGTYRWETWIDENTMYGAHSFTFMRNGTVVDTRYDGDNVEVVEASGTWLFRVRGNRVQFAMDSGKHKGKFDPPDSEGWLTIQGDGNLRGVGRNYVFLGKPKLFIKQ